MASYSGAYALGPTFSGTIAQGEPSVLNITPRDSSYELQVWELCDEILEPRVVNIWTVEIQEDDGVLPHSFGRDNLFCRVWVSPVLVDTGFIVEILNYTIQIWNAWLDRSVMMTNIDSLSPEGTSLLPDSVPRGIDVFWSIELGLTIYRDGPPTQNTKYYITVDGNVYTIEVMGTRVIAFPFFPDWDSNQEIIYSHKTSINRGSKLKEQRIPLQNDILRRFSYSYILDNWRGQQFFNLLAYARDKVLGTPVISEPVLVNGNVQGFSVITPINDISNYWNLQNRCGYLLFIEENGIGEIKEIFSVSSTEIELKNAVVGSYSSSLVIYPMVLTFINTVKNDHITDEIRQLTVDYREYNG